MKFQYHVTYKIYIIMKHIKILITIFCVFFISNKNKAQQITDTLNYVKQFEINKSNYIGQPFSQLLNNMTSLQPKTVNSLVGIWGQNSISFSCFNFTEKDKQYDKETVYMIITWQTPLSSSDTKSLTVQNGFLFTNDEKNYYGSKVIKDIEVLKN